MHQVDEKPEDDSDALAPKVRSMVEAAGSEVAALAAAARKEQQLKEELHAQQQLAASERIAAASQKLKQEVDRQELQNSQLMQQVQTQAAKNKQAQGVVISEPDLEQVEVKEDPAKLEKCLEDLQRTSRE
jgi:PHD/YefM family antitoxin component YafN of YafNO toxin-antitoxin module